MPGGVVSIARVPVQSAHTDRTCLPRQFLANFEGHLERAIRDQCRRVSIRDMLCVQRPEEATRCSDRVSMLRIARKSAHPNNKYAVCFYHCGVESSRTRCLGSLAMYLQPWYRGCTLLYQSRVFLRSVLVPAPRRQHAFSSRNAEASFFLSVVVV